MIAPRPAVVHIATMQTVNNSKTNKGSKRDATLPRTDAASLILREKLLAGVWFGWTPHGTR